MTTSRTFDPADLLAHEPWLRRLAWHLVRDEARVDDVVQETWRRALERPPRDRKALPAWLARVARNTANETRRSEGRRRARELRRAPPTSTESTLDVVARTEMHRRLVQGVLALEEPYRQTLLLRYFDGLSTRVIAQRLGVKTSTVRSRLMRGIDRLRTQLDMDHGGERRGWALALVPLAAPRIGAVAGGVAMTLSTKLLPLALLALVLLAIGVTSVYLGVDRPGNDPGIAGRAVEADDGVPEAPRLVGTQADGRASPAHPARGDAVITGIVLDGSGLPVAGVPIQVRAEWEAYDRDLLSMRDVLTASGPPAPSWEGRSGKDGRFRFTGTVPCLRMWVGAVPDAPRFGSRAFVQCVEGRPSHVLLVVGQGVMLRGRVVGAGGKGMPAWIDLGIPWAEKSWSPGAGAFEMRGIATDAEGRFTVAGVMPRRLLLSAYVPSHASRNLVVDASVGEEIVVRMGEEAGCVVEGSVRDTQGAPVRGALVLVCAKGRRLGSGVKEMLCRTARTTDEGRYRIGHLPAGKVQQIRVEAKGYLPPPGITGYDAPLDPERVRRFDVTLFKAATLHGRVVDAEGRGLAGVPVHVGMPTPSLSGLASSEIPRAVTDEDGRYRMTEVPPRRWRVSSKGGPGWSGAGVIVTVPEGGDIEAPPLVLSAEELAAARHAGRTSGTAPDRVVGGPGSSLEGAVLAAGGTPLPGLVIRASREGGPTLDTTSGPFGRFRFDGLSEGTWRLGSRPTSGAGTDLAEAVEVEVSGSSRPVWVDLQVPEVYALAGVVVDPDDGQPVPGVTVSAFPAGSTRGAAPRARATTDAEGRFGLRVFRDQEWRFEVGHHACQEVARSGERTLRLRSRPDGERRHQALEVLVRDEEGRVVPHAEVWVLQRRDPPPGFPPVDFGMHRTALRAGGGRFYGDVEIRGDTIGIQVSEPRDVMGRPLNLQARTLSDLDPRATKHEVVLSSGREVLVRVLAEDGTPMPSVRLFVRWGTPPKLPVPMIEETAFETDADGCCRLVGLPLDRQAFVYALLEPPYPSPPPAAIPVSSSAITLRCPTAVDVSKKIVDGDGSSVVGENGVVSPTPAVGVLAGRVDGGGALPPSSRVKVVRTDGARIPAIDWASVRPDGTFRIASMPPGRYELRVIALRGGVLRVADVVSPATDLVIDLPVLNHLELRIKGEGVAGFGLAWLAEASPEKGWSTTGANAVGRLVLTFADDDLLTVVALKDGDPRIAVAEHVRPSEGLLVLDLVVGLEISGRIEGYDLERDRHGEISVLWAGVNRVADIDGGGAFRIQGLPPGPHEVWVSLAGAGVRILHGVEAGTTDLVIPARGS